MAVLIVEGEPWLSLDISEALDDEGYDVISVAYPDNAIEALEARNDIHTVLTDLDVRGSMDGLKLAAAVRERWPPVNVIVSTGNGRGLLAVTRYPRELCLSPSRIAARKWYRLCVRSSERLPLNRVRDMSASADIFDSISSWLVHVRFRSFAT